MKKTTILIALGLIAASLEPVAAQDAAPAPDAVPPPVEAPRCGGLLCDMGILGRTSTTLPCNDFLCRAVGGRQAEAAPPPPEPVAAPEPEPTKPKVKKRKRVAKVAQAPTATVPSTPKAPQ